MFEETTPYDGIKFEIKHVKITDTNGKIIFEDHIEFPKDFDDNAAAIVASRYLCNNAKQKENSIKQMFDRVSNTIADWGTNQGYFNTEKEYLEFRYDLKKYQIQKYFAFNSPVYFNVGLKKNPQTSACFILKIEDSMDSISEVGKLEARIFKQGSGSGMNLSPLRSSKETVSAGGLASGPVSFLKGHDVSAGIIKSGGTLRRSAKLAKLDVNHPDIIDIIDCKLFEEEKLKILKNAGIKPRPGFDLSDEVFFQNTNITIGITDEFMKAAIDNKDWWTISVKDNQNFEKFKARDILRKISETSWKIADPGIQFNDTINKWNTCSNSGRINSSNPCGEYIFLDDSSCNLASINLLKFFTKDENNIIHFDAETFIKVIKMIITAQDIIINKSGYPSPEIEQNSKQFRPLGLGYSNLGALLMYIGLPYDSQDGRNLAANLTALITGIAYQQSSNLANILNPFDKFEINKESFYNVLNKHYEHVKNINFITEDIFGIYNEVRKVWDDLGKHITSYFLIDQNNCAKFRNAQVTLLAPTGTISSIMNCITTGVEPEFSLIRYKRLAGSDGATLKFINPIVEESLINLGYNSSEIPDLVDELINDNAYGISNSIDELINNTSKITKFKSQFHRNVFLTASPTPNTNQCISYMGHVRMLAAVQPFISGAISKTINLPKECSIDEIYDLYIKAWSMGLKGVTIYRDGSKEFQPLSTTKEKEEDSIIKNLSPEIKSKTGKRRLPEERPALTHKFKIAGTEGYLTCGMYPEDGTLGEIFVNISKEGSTLSGFADAIATVVSISLQYGVPLEEFVAKLSYLKFEPHGFTSNPNIRSANSIIDYIFRYLGYKFLPLENKKELGLLTDEESKIESNMTTKNLPKSKDLIGPPCGNCGAIMVKKGSCFFCNNCGNNMGSCG